MPKGIMGNGVYGICWDFRFFNDIEGNIANKFNYAFSFLDGKHREPQSINAKLFLPIIPIGIVAYALTLLWDNLCRNSCMEMRFNTSDESSLRVSPVDKIMTLFVVY